MKTIVLLSEFYKKNIIAVLFLLLFMIVSIFNSVELLGYIGFKTFSLKTMNTLNLNDGIYCMPASADLQLYNSITQGSYTAIDTVINPPISYIGYGENNVANIIICDEQFIEKFNFADHGDWLSLSREEEPIEVVVGGSMFSNIQVNQEIELNVYNFDNTFDHSERVKVIGIDVEPTMGFNFGFTASSVTASDIFSNDNNIIYMSKDDFMRIYGADVSSRSSNFIICFDKSASYDEKMQVINHVSQYGRYVTLQDIISESQADLSALLKQQLPFPIFMLFISTYAMLSVAILLTYKQLYDYRIYYLVGCSRKRTFGITLIGISLIGLVAGIINIIYLSILSNFFDFIKAQNFSKYYNYLVLNESIIFIWIFVFFVSVTAVLIPFQLLRKNTAIELYRRK